MKLRLHKFTQGTLAQSSKINENFDALKEAIEKQTDTIDSTLSAAITELETSVEEKKTDLDNFCEQEIEKVKNVAEEIGGGGGGMPTDICKRLNIEYDVENRKVKLKWKDPNDTFNTFGQILSSWAGTMIVCKANSYPENHDDGTVILNNKERHKYLNSEFVYNVPDDIEDITTLKFRAFPYSANKVYNRNTLNCFDEVIIYEFLWDSTNSNVNGSISYPSGCLNEYFKPAKMDYEKNIFDYGSWGDTFIMNLARPCMLYNQNATDQEGNSLSGKIMEFLDPYDYSKTINGEESHVADVTCNANAMVQWNVESLWYKIIEYSPKKYHVKIANKNVDGSYKNLLQYNKSGNIRKYYYRSIYDACNINNLLRSISGKTPCVNTAGNLQIQYAQSNGVGYDVDEARFIMTRNLLLLLIGKSTDVQTIFGAGRNAGGSSTNYNQVTSGTLNNKGPFYGDNSNGPCKVFHSENPWGNIWKIMQGIIQKNSTLYLKTTPSTNDGSSALAYNDTGDNYINTGIVLSGSSGGYISSITLIEESCFLPSIVSGSSSTFIPDGCWWTANGFARFGGTSDDGLLCGAFTLNVNNPASFSDWTFGAALSYTPL